MEERTSGFRPVQKKKGRFNLMDLFLILFIAGLVFFTVFVVDPFSIGLFDKEEQSVALEYTVRIENVEVAFIDKIKVRNEVVDASIKASLGFVSSVENDTPHAEPYYDYQADLVSMKEYPDRYDLIVTITTNASFTEGVGYTVNGRRVAVGAKLYMMFPEFLGEGYCVSLREIG